MGNKEKYFFYGIVKDSTKNDVVVILSNSERTIVNDIFPNGAEGLLRVGAKSDIANWLDHDGLALRPGEMKKFVRDYNCSFEKFDSRLEMLYNLCRH